MATKTASKEKKLVKCEKCGKEVKNLMSHQRMSHGDMLKHNPSFIRAQVADLTAKLSASESKIKELEIAVTKTPVAAPAPAAVLSDVDKKAMFSDWLSSLTFEAWSQIGNEKGWVEDVSAADPRLDSKPNAAQMVYPATRTLFVRR